MKAPNATSRQGKLQPGSTCNEDTRHELDRQQDRIISKWEAIDGNDLTYSQSTSDDQVHDIAALVWRFFADEIRQALIEVQQLLDVGNDAGHD